MQKCLNHMFFFFFLSYYVAALLFNRIALFLFAEIQSMSSCCYYFFPTGKTFYKCRPNLLFLSRNAFCYVYPCTWKLLKTLLYCCIRQAINQFGYCVLIILTISQLLNDPLINLGPWHESSINEKKSFRKKSKCNKIK